MKTCKECGITKELSNFGIDKSRADGHRHWCKTCNSAKIKIRRDNNIEHYRAKAREWHHQNKELKNNRTKQWAAQNPEKRKEINRRWRKANSSYLAERMVQYRKNNPDSYKNWVKDNPEMARANWAKRRARELNATTHHISQKEIRRMYKSPCFYCKETGKKMHLDHVIPISRGGNHSIGNLVPACWKCNQSKNNKTIMEWRINESKRMG